MVKSIADLARMMTMTTKDEVMTTNEPTTGSLYVYQETYVICPKHGKHKHYIQSNIAGHEGVWCQICWLESLGEPLPLERG